MMTNSYFPKMKSFQHQTQASTDEVNHIFYGSFPCLQNYSSFPLDSEEIVQAALDSLLSNNKGITTVIVAHRLRTVRNADAIAVIKQGQIVELGPHEDLMKLPHGYYKGMVEKSLGGKLVDF